MKSWYDERALTSRLSADVYLRQLGGTSARLRLDPDEIAKVAAKDPERFHDLLIRYAADLKREGRLDSYIAKTFDGLRSWLRSRRVKFDEFPRVGRARNESIQTEIPPTPEQLRTILYGGMSLRGRTSALFMAHAGLRPGVLGSYQARDGLTLGDLPELKFGDIPKFAEVPFVIRVPSRLSKTRRTYTTFGTKELADSLIAYLRGRTERGETLSPKSPVIAADPLGMARGYAKDTGFLTTKGIVKELREEIAKNVPDGTRLRPYSLRSYCSTRLLIAEANGKIPAALREAILGHDGGVAARYNVGKPWGPELLKEARAAYQRAAPYLETTGGPTTSAQDIQREAAVLLLMGPGRSEAEARRMVEGKSGEELANLLRSSERPERVVPADDAPKLIEVGWTLAGSLKNGEMAVLRAPAEAPALGG